VGFGKKCGGIRHQQNVVLRPGVGEEVLLEQGEVAQVGLEEVVEDVADDRDDADEDVEDDVEELGLANCGREGIGGKSIRVQGRPHPGSGSRQEDNLRQQRRPGHSLPSLPRPTRKIQKRLCCSTRRDEQ
jgi:hypothetical protein